MRSRHNTIRAVAIGIGLILLVVTGTAAMMAAFSPTPAPTDIYRRAAAPAVEPATVVATGNDNVLYERVVLADGRTQWVMIEEPGTTLSLAKRPDAASVTAAAGINTSSGYAAMPKPVSYSLMTKPSGLSKPVTQCSRSARGAYDIACNTMI